MRPQQYKTDLTFQMHHHTIQIPKKKNFSDLMGEGLVLLSHWASPFGLRVQLALAEKGVEFEYKEQDLFNKSPLLLQYNPVHKKIPVLIHDGRTICESLNIVQYIDEVWNERSPLLPRDPYQRAHARFWGDYIDKKIYNCGKRILYNKGEEKEAAKKELIECLKLLEGELGDKPYFAGETFGFVDVALITFSGRLYTYEAEGRFSIEEECPKLKRWVSRCMERESVSKTLPNPHAVHEWSMSLKKRFGAE